MGVDCPYRVADDYALAMLRDQTSRTHAAVEEWSQPLHDWIATRHLMLAAGAAGVESLDWPWLQEPDATLDEYSRARAWHDAHSAIPD